MTTASKGELWGKIIEPELALKEFVKGASQDPTEIEKLFENNLFKQLTSTLKDSQDFTSIEALVKASESPNYDLIILDTPPIQNLTDFFDAPENMYNLFNSSFFKIISGSSSSKSLIKKFVGQGAKGVLALLSRVTGQQFVEELLIFFKCIESLTVEIKSHSKKVDELLSSENTAYVLITDADSVKLREIENIYAELKKRKYVLHTTILNRCYPKWFANHKSINTSQLYKNKPTFDKELMYFKERQKIIDSFCQRQKLPGNIVKLPVLEGINSIEDINKMSKALSELEVK